MPVIPALIAACAFLAVVLLVVGLSLQTTATKRSKARAALDRYASASGGGAGDDDVNTDRTPGILDAIGGALVPAGYRARLTDEATLAGLAEDEAIAALIRRKVVYALVATLVMTLLALVTNSLAVWILALLSPAVGFFLPDLLLRNQVQHRTEDVGRQFADALDLLSLCVKSGLSFEQSLEQLARTQGGAIAEEFSRVLRELQVGASLSQALGSMSARSRNADLQRFVTAVQQADRLGIPMSTVLEELSRDMRNKRREKAREQAQKVPIKILMPVMGCFLPGLVIIVVGPAIVALAFAFSNF